MEMHGIKTIIKTDGTLVKEAKTEAVGLEELQAAVGGYIEAVSGFDTYLGKKAVAFCNEEGKLKGLAYNDQATRFWSYAALGLQDALFGDVVILTGDDEFMETI
jgi:hypothetical protein